MGKPAFQLLLCALGLQAPPRPPAPADLLVIATLGTPCLPAAHARISLPALGRWTVADSLGQGTIRSVPAGDVRILITHFGVALSGTVRLPPGGGQVVLADLRSRELRIVSIGSADVGGGSALGGFSVQRRLPAHREPAPMNSEGDAMPFRVVPIARAVTEEVRRTGKAPGDGHPAYQDTAAGYGPCRSCLQPFQIGRDERILFTYDPFMDIEQLPLPGPIYVHKHDCTPYETAGAFPEALRFIPTTLQAYASGRRLREVAYVEPNGDHEAVVRRLLSQDNVDYLQARNTDAGCYMFRIERT